VDLKKSLKLKEDSFIPHAEVRGKIGRSFSINKQQIREILNFLEYAGFVELSKAGVKLNFEIDNGN